MKITLQLSILLLISLSPLAVRADHPDHPLITRYPDSIMATKKTSAFDEYNLIIGVDEGIKMKTIALQGKVTKMRYRNAKERSVLEIYKNYKSALTKAGLNIIFECEKKACGPTYSSTGWSQTAGITVKSGAESAYLAGKMTMQDDTQMHVAIMVGRRQHQIHLVEVTEMESDLVKVDPKALLKGLTENGFVSIYGIYFDTGKSDIKPTSEQALGAIASLLKDNPKLKLYVVGHTDNVGKLDANMRLSNQRANATVQALVSRYKIDRLRLMAQGVGPLAPKATNVSEQGRSMNRRVELVQSNL